MSTISATDLSNLVAARRLLQMAEHEDARRSGRDVEEKSALDYMEEDQALISDAAHETRSQALPSLPQIENLNINLSELHQAHNGEAGPGPKNEAQATHVVENIQSVEIQFELRYHSNTPINGLVVHDQNYAESDRYLFKFADGATFTILDKWANKSTTIWGDPHVDVDDVDGNNNGDFKDLKASSEITTFMLSDGTRLTFKAQDAGIIEHVDIFKGSQHIKGKGAAAKDFTAEAGLFSPTVLTDGMSTASATPLGDVVRAGGDGNDWFDVNNKMVWGKTTGPIMTQRPAATLEFYYKQTVRQAISQTKTVNA
ncbi:MAG TPA: DUF1521 domain-containing protein [Anaerolineales bacterium]|nr:DUF1521 domain-containing protein [Anaerolineales bacterium]